MVELSIKHGLGLPDYSSITGVVGTVGNGLVGDGPGPAATGEGGGPAADAMKKRKSTISVLLGKGDKHDPAFGKFRSSGSMFQIAFSSHVGCEGTLWAVDMGSHR